MQQEMMKLIYQAGSIVYVSIHSLSKVSKYRAHDDNATPPRLSKLGTGAWEKIKTATKKKIKDIAADLIKLYSQRLQQTGFAYTGDTSTPSSIS